MSVDSLLPSRAEAELSVAKDTCHEVMCTLEIVVERLRQIDNALPETQDGQDSGLSAIIGALQGQITAVSGMADDLNRLDEVVAREPQL